MAYLKNLPVDDMAYLTANYYLFNGQILRHTRTPVIREQIDLDDKLAFSINLH